MDTQARPAINVNRLLIWPSCAANLELRGTKMSLNFSGAWVADLAASRLLEAQPTAMMITFQHHGSELKEVVVVLRADRQEQPIVFQGRTDGQEGQGLLDGKPVRGGARWEGDELVVEIWATSGGRHPHLCDYWRLSPDGQTLSGWAAMITGISRPCFVLGYDFSRAPHGRK
jgi:hypothetical protein